MKLLISADPEYLPAAADLGLKEAVDYAKYDRVGWGWSFGNHGHGVGPKFFVRRLTDGLSVRQVKP